MNKFLISILCLFPAFLLGQKPKDAANLDWQNEIPRVVFPDMQFCTDNGAMIALVGALRMAKQGQRDYAFTVRPRWPLTDLCRADQESEKQSCKSLSHN